MRKTLKKSIYLSLGIFFVLLGLLGVFLPLLPTTPFIILATFFFSQSSETCHRWLLNNRVFGPVLYNWEKNRCIPLFAKKLSFTMIFFFGSFSLYTIPLIWVKILTAALIGYACYFIYSIDTCAAEESQEK